LNAHPPFLPTSVNPPELPLGTRLTMCQDALPDVDAASADVATADADAHPATATTPAATTADVTTADATTAARSPRRRPARAPNPSDLI
jgi:hypothetical protein